MGFIALGIEHISIGTLNIFLCNCSVFMVYTHVHAWICLIFLSLSLVTYPASWFQSRPEYSNIYPSTQALQEEEEKGLVTAHMRLGLHCNRLCYHSDRLRILHDVQFYGR